MPDPDAQPGAETLNAMQRGFNRALGMRFVTATAEEVVLEWDVDERHHQIYGLVHGGVHCGAIETATSVGAALFAGASGLGIVGLENHTSFIRAVRSGRLRCTAVPITRGRRTQVWEATVRDEEGRVVATGRVRLLCVAPDVPLGGQAIGQLLPSAPDSDAGLKSS